MTIDQALQKTHREYEGDTDYLEFEDEETQLRVEYLKDGIRDYVDKFPEYNEAFYSLEDAVDGDTTITGGTADCPTNFVRISGRVQVGDGTYLTYADPASYERLIEENSAAEAYTVLGYPGAHVIKVNPAPADGTAIDYGYYGEIDLPDTTTDIIPINRPLYAVYYTLWKIFKEDDPDQAADALSQMKEQERLERVALAKTPGERNVLSLNGAGFGDSTSTVSNVLTGR